MAATAGAVFRIIKQHLPASSGMFTHSGYWLTASSNGSVYSNPVLLESDRTDLIDIYCTHGTADRAGSFTSMIENILEKGWPHNIRSIHLLAFKKRATGQGIEFFAEQLAQQIVANGHKRVILMGHSRGGLVNSWFAEFMAAGLGIQVDRLLNFGTPFQASTLALPPLTWFSKSVVQMQSGSELLHKLRERIIVSGLEYYFILGGNDWIVWGERAYIPEYVRQYPDSLLNLSYHGHISMMSTKQSIVSICSILFRPPRSENIEGKVTLYHPLDSIKIIENYSSETFRAET